MSGKGTIKNFADILGTAKLPERTIQICLRGDLVADFEELERQLTKAHDDRESSNSLDAGSEIAELTEQIDQLREQMQEHTYSFRLRALTRRAYRALVAEHPPRKVIAADGTETIHEADTLGFNLETFMEPLLRTAIIDPELTNALWEQLLDNITDRQFEDLSTAAWLLNRQEVDIPFSRAALRSSPSSEPE